MLRTYFIIALIGFTLASPVLAKQKEPVEKELTVDDIVAKMKFQLELTDAQAQAVKPIIVDFMAREKALKEEEKKALSKVLTSEQMYTWNFLQNEKPKEKKKHAF